MILPRSKNDRKWREKVQKWQKIFRRWDSEWIQEPDRLSVPIFSDFYILTFLTFLDQFSDFVWFGSIFWHFETIFWHLLIGSIFWQFWCHPQPNLTQISILKSTFWNEKSRPDWFQNEFVCEQVGVEPPLDKLFKIEFTKSQVQRKNQNIFELLKIFLFDTPHLTKYEKFRNFKWSQHLFKWIFHQKCFNL